MSAYILEIDKEHEPEYLAFYSKYSLNSYVEYHIRNKIGDRFDEYSEVLGYLGEGSPVKDPWDGLIRAIAWWGENENEYLKLHTREPVANIDFLHKLHNLRNDERLHGLGKRREGGI